MTLSDLKGFALESPVGRLAYSAALRLRARSATGDYEALRAALRAWRASSPRWSQQRAITLLRSALTDEGRLVPLRSNPLRGEFVRSPAARAIRAEFAGYPVADRVRMRYPREASDEGRQGDLIILKAASGDEKGVLLIKYSEAIARFVALFEVETLARRYAIVIEPSWWGYQDISFFLLSGSDAVVVVQAQAQDDYRFLEQHGFGLNALDAGAGDWVDPDTFSPSTGEREYDVVMVSSWNPYKRHRDLFAALQKLRRNENRIIRTALVGYPNGWTVKRIEAELKRYGIRDQCDVFDSITPNAVADIVGRSRLYVLLSRREGANKAMYEAMFCDTPVLAPRDHRGINLAHLNERTGLTFTKGNLIDGIKSGLAKNDQFSPRTWAQRETGYRRTTERLNAALRELMAQRNEPWSTPIVPKKNEPNLRYASLEDQQILSPHYEALVPFLRSYDRE